MSKVEELKELIGSFVSHSEAIHVDAKSNYISSPLYWNNCIFGIALKNIIIEFMMGSEWRDIHVTRIAKTEMFSLHISFDQKKDEPIFNRIMSIFNYKNKEYLDKRTDAAEQKAELLIKELKKVLGEA